jgi:hypothetical protein
MSRFLKPNYYSKNINFIKVIITIKLINEKSKINQMLSSVASEMLIKIGLV